MSLSIKLSEREFELLKYRFGVDSEPHAMEETLEHFGISSGHYEQIIYKAARFYSQELPGDELDENEQLRRIFIKHTRVHSHKPEDFLD